MGVWALKRHSDHEIGGPQQRTNAVLRRVGKGARGVEVGVFRGVMSSLLLKGGVSRLFMVDNWLPTNKQPKAYKATRDGMAHLSAEEAVSNRDKALAVARRHPGAAVVLGMDSINAAAQINDGSMDFVFLDGDHSYEGVIADIAAWVPKVRKGGWIGGHDYDNDHPDYDFSGVKRAVDEVFGAVGTDENFTWFHQCG